MAPALRDKYRAIVTPSSTNHVLRDKITVSLPKKNDGPGEDGYKSRSVDISTGTALVMNNGNLGEPDMARSQVRIGTHRCTGYG